jgi:hypothetical protein
MRIFILALSLLLTTGLYAGSTYWQQHVQYTMNVDLNSENHQFSGSQKLVYTNNSPDQLSRVFYHLYFNAFQPGSMMDVRSRTIADPDPRVGDRIFHLKPEEQGWLRVQTLTMNGKPVSFEEVGTILEVNLPKPIAPGAKVTFEMTFVGQVPLQIRRSGRDNKEGIDYSMAQWYPKMCEYDDEGWHATPYVGREFHGVWGDFDVTLNLDSKYTVGATGELVNAKSIGRGYTTDEVLPVINNGKISWRFVAKNVHDFVWAADPDYMHTSVQMEKGPMLHFFHQPNALYDDNWKELERLTVEAFKYMSEKFGTYPYPQYSVIQGGDGGMEYPMATLITGERNLRSLVGVTMHEAAHSWYHGVLATNETLYEWMDEGFCSFATSRTLAHLFADPLKKNPHQAAYQSYLSLARSGADEALVTPADHYITNDAYGVAAYSKGEVLLEQLGYIIGDDLRDFGLLAYYERWKFKHPDPTAFKRVMEDVSGLELDWYFQYFVNSRHTIDYSVSAIQGTEKSTFITLHRENEMPMPIDVLVEFRDGSKVYYNIPLESMRGHKQPQLNGVEMTVLPRWAWTNTDYTFELSVPVSEVVMIEIDPGIHMADIDRSNNALMLAPGTTIFLRN